MCRGIGAGDDAGSRLSEGRPSRRKREREARPRSTVRRRRFGFGRIAGAEAYLTATLILGDANQSRTPAISRTKQCHCPPMTGDGRIALTHDEGRRTPPRGAEIARSITPKNFSSFVSSSEVLHEYHERSPANPGRTTTGMLIAMSAALGRRGRPRQATAARALLYSTTRVGLRCTGRDRL
jgi:hypothetical protein